MHSFAPVSDLNKSTRKFRAGDVAGLIRIPGLSPCCGDEVGPDLDVPDAAQRVAEAVEELELAPRNAGALAQPETHAQACK